MTTTLEHRVRATAPDAVAALDHLALQRRGRRRRRARRAAQGGSLAAVVVLALGAAVPWITQGAPPAYLGVDGRTAAPDVAERWPEGQAGAVDWSLSPIDAVDLTDVPADAVTADCELWLGYELADGHRGGQSVCAPGWRVRTVERVTVLDDDRREVVDLLLLLAHGRVGEIGLELHDGPTLHPQLDYLGELEHGPRMSFGLVDVAPGTGVDRFGDLD